MVRRNGGSASNESWMRSRNAISARIRDQWLAVEHYRLNAVQAWPDGPRKQAAIAAIGSTMASMSRLTSWTVWQSPQDRRRS